MQERFEEKSAKVTDKCVSKLFFMGKFRLAEQTFEQGLADQEFYEVVGVDGKLRYSWTQQEQTNVQGSKSSLEQCQGLVQG